MKKLFVLLSFFLSQAAFAAASQQGCESSGGTAAGCSNTATSSSSNTLDNRNINVNRTTNVNDNFNSTSSASSSNANGFSSVGDVTATGGTGIGIGGNGGNGGTGVGNAAAQAGATNSGVNNNTTVSSTYKAAAPSAPDVINSPTANCRITVGVSGSLVGGSVGFGTSVEDEGCTLRENARLLHNLGETAAAKALLCFDAKVAMVLPNCNGSQIRLVGDLDPSSQALGQLDIYK